jgi:hypothetical protein
LFAVAHLCCQDTGSDRADARDRQQTPTEVVVGELLCNFLVEGLESKVVYEGVEAEG